MHAASHTSACGRRRDCRRSTYARHSRHGHCRAGGHPEKGDRRHPPARGPSPRNVCRSKAVTSGTVNARVYLAPSHQAELAGDVAAVSTPGSKSYRHFWTTAAVRKEFAPSAAEIASVKSWLTAAGLSVTSSNAKYPAGAYIGVRGSVAAASKAFGVTFGTYRGPGGQSARAPDQAATAPSSVASSILAVSGLDTAKSVIKPAACRRPGRTTGWPSRARPTTASRSRPTSPRPTASTSPGPTAATRRARSAAPTE